MKKEQESIEIAKKFTKMDFSNPMGWTGYYDTGLKELSQAIETVLNMLKEKDKEIEELKQALARNIAKNFTSSMKESAKSKEDLEMLNKGWQIELEKKDKIIDLMAEQIKIPEPTMKIESFDIKSKTKFGMRYLNKEEVKQYFERKIRE